MNKRIIKIIKIIEGRGTQLEVVLYYEIGGMNYFQGCSMPRGLYLSATPVTVAPNSRITSGFSGTTSHVLDMKRFNQKTLDSYVPNKELVERLINNVVNKNNLTLEPYE